MGAWGQATEVLAITQEIGNRRASVVDAVWGLTKIADPKIAPRMVGFPNKVPLISETPILQNVCRMFAAVLC